ncbi:MAG: hypothetical protein ACRCWQ_02360 [Bacilli bacterium]
MNGFIKLVNYELQRIAKPFIGLTIIVSVIQAISVYLSVAKNVDSLQEEQIFNVMYNLMKNYEVTVVLTFGAVGNIVLLYTLVIWYRDWFGKSKEIYSLFMMPVSRFTIYLSKLSTILLTTGMFFSAQLVQYPFQNWLYTTLSPKLEGEYQLTLENWMNGTNYIMSAFDLGNYKTFILIWSIIIVSILTSFTFVMLERSFGIKGIVLGIVSGVGTLFIMSAVIFSESLDWMMITNDRFTSLVVITMLLIGVHVLVSRWLLLKKINL